MMSQADLQSWLEGDAQCKALPGYRELLDVVNETQPDFTTWPALERRYVADAGTECSRLALRITTEALRRRAGEYCWWRWLLSGWGSSWIGVGVRRLACLDLWTRPICATWVICLVGEGVGHLLRSRECERQPRVSPPFVIFW